MKNQGIERKAIHVSTSDGLELTFWLWDQQRVKDKLLIVAPGFGQHHGTNIMKHVARLFWDKRDVLGVDFRGMAGNPGRYGFGYAEHLDLQAAFAWAKRQGYKEVELIGFSMGAYISLRALAEYPGFIQRCYFVSGPTCIEDIVRTGGPLRQAAWILTHWAHVRLRVWAGSQYFFRWDWPLRSQPSAVELAPRVRIPVHFLTGTDDQLVLPKLTRAVFNAKKGKKSLTELGDGQHAEYMALAQPGAFLAWMKSCKNS